MIDLLKVRRRLSKDRTSSLEWSGEDPDGRKIGIVPRGRTMLSSVEPKRRKSWLLAASALVPISLCQPESVLAQCSALDASGNATCNSVGNAIFTQVGSSFGLFQRWWLSKR